MKRLAFVVAAAVVCVGALLLLIVALLPGEMLKTRIGEQISGWTGRDVSLSGEPRIGFFPRLSVTLDDVRVGGPVGMAAAEILSMDRLKGTIRLLPLIIGRVEVDSFTMVRPLIRLVRDADGQRNWEFDSGAAALQLAFAGDVPLGVFRLEGGTVLYEDRQAGETERLDSVDVSIDWASVRHPIAIEGSGIWRGEAVSVSGAAEAPFAYLNGAATPVEARIEAGPLGMVLTGEARDYPQMQLAGALRLTTPSFRRFAAWLGSPIGPGSTLGAASVFGQATLRDNILSVADAQFTLDGNGATGALRIAAGSTPDIAGTLAFGALDLTPYFIGLSAALALQSDWRDVELPTDWLGDINADVRLSAESVALGRLTAANTAASVSLRDGRLEIGLARADFDAGSISGDLEVVDSPRGPGAGFTAQLRATEIDLAGMGPFLRLPAGVSGTASAVFDATTNGRDLGSLVGSLGGSAGLKIAEGKVPLFGIGAIAASGSAADQTAAEALTPFPVHSAAVRLAFAQGVGAVEQASVVAPTFSAEAEGRLDLRGGKLDLSGTLRAGAPGSPPGAETPFTVEGLLVRPVARRQALAN